ncbi:Hypothetical predicted protein, partial [Marmota monax]
KLAFILLRNEARAVGRFLGKMPIGGIEVQGLELEVSWTGKQNWGQYKGLPVAQRGFASDCQHKGQSILDGQ